MHLAAPGLGALSAAEEFRINMVGLVNILEAGRISGVSRISIASSIAVYAGLSAGPYHKDQPLRIESSSSTEAFKKAFETLALHYSQRNKTEVIALRISATWGPLYHSMFNLPSRRYCIESRKARISQGLCSISKTMPWYFELATESAESTSAVTKVLNKD